MQDFHQFIYLYDLPKDCGSIKIASTFKERCGIIFEQNQQPQIKRDLSRLFYTAMVVIKDPKKFTEACEKMRYFEIDGKQCRALPFDKQLLGSNKEKLQTHNVFVKVPKDMKHEELHEKFEKIGNIKSLKISLNPDYSSRGYGFICFQEEEFAKKAVEAGKIGDIEARKFEPKDKKDFRKVINNIYVKNIPVEKTDDEIKKMFEPFGNIISLKFGQADKVQQFKFALVCYADKDKKDHEYGPQCAQKAILAMNEFEIAPGVKLSVRPALNKDERKAEKERDTIRYKASKKRCNLFVKNFPKSWGEENLKDLFGQFGEVEKIKVGDKNNSGNAYAFICYKEPTDAAKAKQVLQNHNCEGKMLIINYYEIKEIRQLHMEAAQDKADWEKYQAQQTGGLKWNDLTSQPHLAQMLQQLLGIIQINEQTAQQMNQNENPRHRNHPRGMRRQNPGYQVGPVQQQMHPGAQQQQQMMQPGQQPPHQMMQPGQQQMPHAQQRMVQPPPIPMQQQPQQPMPMQNQAAMNPAQMTIAQKYQQDTIRLLPAIQPHNPHLKSQVGHCIYPYVQQLVGDDKAPKITGMLIELPLDQIKAYMSDFQNLQLKVKDALEHWENAQQQQMGQF